MFVVGELVLVTEKTISEGCLNCVAEINRTTLEDTFIVVVKKHTDKCTSDGGVTNFNEEEIQKLNQQSLIKVLYL